MMMMVKTTLMVKMMVMMMLGMMVKKMMVIKLIETKADREGIVVYYLSARSRWTRARMWINKAMVKTMCL